MSGCNSLPESAPKQFQNIIMEETIKKASQSSVAILDLKYQNSATNFINQFLTWFDQRCSEQQLEISEFMGHFCYQSLYTKLASTMEKIFAFREYLLLNKLDPANSVRILQLVDEVMDMILDINHAAENKFYNKEELLDELPDIVSLQSIITHLPERNQKWNYTYLQWQRFKSQFTIFKKEINPVTIAFD